MDNTGTPSIYDRPRFLSGGSQDLAAVTIHLIHGSVGAVSITDPMSPISPFFSANGAFPGNGHPRRHQHCCLPITCCLWIFSWQAPSFPTEHCSFYWLTFSMCLLCASHCTKQFTWMTSSYPVRNILLLCPFCRWGNWGDGGMDDGQSWDPNPVLATKPAFLNDYVK